MTCLHVSKQCAHLEEGALFDLEDVHTRLNSNYKITYIGFYRHVPTSQVSLYIQCKSKMSSNVVRVLLRDLLDIKNIQPFTEVCNNTEMLEEKGELKKPGGVKGKRRRVTRGASAEDAVSKKKNKSKRDVAVNRFGEESLQHITGAFVSNLLARGLGWSVLCDFAAELYRLEENMNFHVRIKERYIKMRVGEEEGKWLTSLKTSECETILCNLVQKICDAVNTYRHDIPGPHLERFEQTLKHIETCRIQAEGSDERYSYDGFARDGVNIIGENMWEVTKRKKIKLM